MSQASPVLKNSTSPSKVDQSPKRSTLTRNFSNPKYHSSLDLAKGYSGKVNTHLHFAKQKNHTLSSAERNYNRQIFKNKVFQSTAGRSKSTLVEKKSSPKPIKIENNKVVRDNPQQNKEGISKSVLIGESEKEHVDRGHYKFVREILTCKVQRVPEYSQQLHEACTEKSKLEKYIKQLKDLINSERKQKTKISLNCNKIMNDREQTYKNYTTRYEENYHLSVMIAQTQKEIQFLQSDISQLNEKNKRVIDNVNQEKRQCQTLQKYVNQTKRVLMNEEKEVAKMKTKVTTKFNNMQNNYLNMNLLLSEKALLLADIDAQHHRNR